MNRQGAKFRQGAVLSYLEILGVLAFQKSDRDQPFYFVVVGDGFAAVASSSFSVKRVR